MTDLKNLVIRRLLRERLGVRIKWMIRTGLDLRLPPGPRPEAKIPLTFRRLDLEDLPLYEKLVGPERLPELGERLRQGQISVGAFHQDRLAGFNWANPREAHDASTGIRFPLKPGEIYSYHKLVHPDYRNLGVGGQLGWEGNRILAAQGYRQKIGFVDFNNYAQRSSIAKWGSRYLGHLIFFQVFGRRFSVTLPLLKPLTSRSFGFLGRKRDRRPDEAQDAS